MKSTKAKLFYTIVGLVVLAFSIVTAVVLHITDPIKTSGGGWTFLSIQIVVNLLFVFVLLYTGFKKKEIAVSYVMVVSTIILQFLPLMIRLLVRGEKPQYMWAVIIAFVSIIAYLAVLFSSDLLNDKVQEVLPTLESNKIKVEDINDYNDQNGKLVSAKRKDS
ncbi:MAG: hypothetical protein RBQ95_06240 [Paracholeplasma sp.]|nr:hypothetical protein [Paracholeplasma sp.]MDY3196443.1 hypothetical protein [Paracholeplasma sp.]